MLNTIAASIGIFLVFLFIYMCISYDPSKEYQAKGRWDAVSAYKLTGVIPHAPSAEELINQGYNSIYIKNYLIGFNEGIDKLQQNIIK